MSMGNFNKAYNLTKIYSNSKQTHEDNPSDNKGFVSAAKVSLLNLSSDNNFDSLYTPYIANKQTRIILRNKLMRVNKKLDKVHVVL